MQKAGILSCRKEGLKIFYAVRRRQVLEIVGLAAEILRQETAGRHEMLRAGETDRERS